MLGTIKQFDTDRLNVMDVYLIEFENSYKTCIVALQLVRVVIGKDESPFKVGCNIFCLTFIC